MKNYAMPLALAIVGFGLMSIGFNLNGNTATATPGVFNAGPEEPTIVWYDAQSVYLTSDWTHVIYRAWSDGTVEARVQVIVDSNNNCEIGSLNCQGWIVISSPTEGLNAAADITFDEVVDGQDLATLLASWGDAPRNPMPPSDCPLGLLN